MSTTAVGGRVVLEDVFTEGADGQYLELDLTDPATGDAISTGAITAITGVLRSLDTELAIFGEGTPADLLATSRASYPGTAGRVRVTFTAADMAASGSRDVQTRELTLRVTHSSGKVFVCAVTFRVSNLRDVS